MSHKTGIKSTPDLLKFFGKCKKKNEKIRLVKVSIENEELVLINYSTVKKSWENDWDQLILGQIEENHPCYIFYRLDDEDKSIQGYYWLLISWTPDTSSIRQKMIYASTKSTLKSEFGTSYLKEEYLATCLDEIKFSGYKKNKAFQQASTPLTQREQEINELRRSEFKTDVGIDSRHQTMSGINCPVSEAAKQALRDMRGGAYNYLHFDIDLEKEEINISKADNIDVVKLSSMMPKDHAGFHIFLFNHSYEGEHYESFIFIYSMPGNYSCSVKERMIYSSSKAPFLELINSLGIAITKKLEIDDPSELLEENLLNELHPKMLLNKIQFAKPKYSPKHPVSRRKKL